MLQNVPFWFLFNERTEELENAIKNGKYSFPEGFWKNVSESGKNFITCLLKVNPSERISAEEALHHPWIQAVNIRRNCCLYFL